MKAVPIYLLLADDDADDRMLFAEAIDDLKMDIRLQTFNDGEQLMNYLHTSEQPLPRILFLDLNMPLKNGMDCLVEIRNSDRLKDITIAIFSTSSRQLNIDETFTKGANVYILKPSDFKSLKIHWKKLLILTGITR